MTREGKFIVFGGAALVIIVAIGIYWWQRGDAGLVQPPSKDSAEFASKIQNFVVRNIGQPIEGFNAEIYLRAFPGLTEEDFNGVETSEGKYVYSDGELNFTRRSVTHRSSAEQAITKRGHETLFNNARARLGGDLFVDDIISRISRFEENQARLYENCARTEFPRSDDSSFNPEKRIVTLYYWDEKLQDNAKLELPFEPETGFAGCSEKAKAILRSFQESYERMIRETEAARGTLIGKVTIGPLCPVEPCPESAPNPYTSRKLVLKPVKGDLTGKEIFVELKPDGGFLLEKLPVGTYQLTITNCDFLGCNYALPKTATIETNKTTRVDIDIDTGIR